ncbi:MAG: polysaccharide lyase [Acidobacteriota bacterium]
MRVSFLLVSVLMVLSAAPGPKGHRSTSGVVFRCDFESPEWYREWGLKEADQHLDTVMEDPHRKFEPWRGKALRVRIGRGEHYGANLSYRFKERLGHEPEEIYFRYHLRLADDWNPERGGKLPGISGTYGRAGWGGRPVNGRDGWSARGNFLPWKNNLTPIGFYCYHADMKGRYGSVWTWDRERRGYLENNRWYAVEQYLKLNTPGQNNGILRGWIDGRLAFEKTDVRFRDVEDLKIEMVWINVYQGGTSPAASEDHLYLDDVAISHHSPGATSP